MNPRAAVDEDLRQVLAGPVVAHLATVLPDGAPHSVPVYVDTHGDRIAILTGPESRKARNLRRDPRVALSMTVPGNIFHPVTIRGRVVGWLHGEQAWQIVDRIAAKYTDIPYPRDEERVIALIEPDPRPAG